MANVQRSSLAYLYNTLESIFPTQTWDMLLKCKSGLVTSLLSYCFRFPVISLLIPLFLAFLNHFVHVCPLYTAYSWILLWEPNWKSFSFNKLNNSFNGLKPVHSDGHISDLNAVILFYNYYVYYICCILYLIFSLFKFIWIFRKVDIFVLVITFVLKKNPNMRLGYCFLI